MPAALNAHLPEDIAVHKCVTVDDDFDARFSCVSKEYTYVIHNSRTRNPFLKNQACFYPQHLDADAMSEAAKHIVGKHDFAALKSEGTPVKSTVRTVYECSVERDGDTVRIKARADGFLYNMVRTIAGTLMYVGIGKIKPEDIPKIIESKDRELAGPTAPACGLYMTSVCYNMEELDG
jgi:tRNA pseudouridine38-40 synthase